MGIEGIPQITSVFAVPGGRPKAPALKTAQSSEAATAPPASGENGPDEGAQRVREQLAAVNRIFQESYRSLSFSVDEASGKTVVRVVDPTDGQIVRQIPSEEALAIAASLRAGEAPTSLGLERWL